MTAEPRRGAVTVASVRTPLALITELLGTYAAIAVFVAIWSNDAAPTLAAVAVMVFGSFALSRALRALDIDERTTRVAGFAASVAALIVVARVEYAPGAWLWETAWLRPLLTDTQATLRAQGHVVAGVAALGVTWIRGVGRAQAPLEPGDVLESASVGLVAVALAAIVAPAARWPESFGPLALLYAVIALCTLAVWHTPEPREPLRTFVSRWSGGLLVLLGVAALLTLGALAADPDAFGFARPAGEPLGQALGTVLLYLLAPIFAAAEYTIRGIGWLLSSIFPDPPNQQPQQPDAQPLPERRQGGPSTFAQVLQWLGAGAIVAAVVIVATLALWFAFHRYARRDERRVPDRVESVEPVSSLRDDLRALFGSLTGRVRRTPAERTVVEVRRLYFEMLDRAAAEGVERPAAATPLQFAPRLDAHFASDAPSRISAAFAASRYGELPVDASTVRALRAAWSLVTTRRTTNH